MLKYTLRAAHLKIGGVDLDLAVEDDVLPLGLTWLSRSGSNGKSGTVLSETNGHYYRHLAMIFPSRSQLIRDLSLTRTDQMEISKRRGDPHRLGFAYQLGFVRVFQRFPVQQPLEICEELLSFVALQTGIDGGLLGDYASWQRSPDTRSESESISG